MKLWKFYDLLDKIEASFIENFEKILLKCYGNFAYLPRNLEQNLCKIWDSPEILKKSRKIFV